MAPFQRSYALKSIRKFNIPHKYRGDWHRRNHAAVKSQARALINYHAKIIKAKLAARRRRRVVAPFRKAKRAPYHQVQRHATWRPKRTRRQRGFKPFQVKYNY